MNCLLETQKSKALKCDFDEILAQWDLANKSQISNIEMRIEIMQFYFELSYVESTITFLKFMNVLLFIIRTNVVMQSLQKTCKMYC